MKTAEARSPNDHPVKGIGERASAFFRYGPSDGFLFFWTLTAGKTVLRNKKVTSWEFWPPQYGIGVPQIFYPVMGAGGVQLNTCFRLHFWTGKNRHQEAENLGKSVHETG